MLPAGRARRPHRRSSAAPAHERRRASPTTRIVRGALEALAADGGRRAGWRVRIEKRIPVAAGLGGGSSDAATALRLANETLDEPLAPARSHEIAARIGADVPFFLARRRRSSAPATAPTLAPLDLPQDFWVLLVLPRRRGEALDRGRLRRLRRARRRRRLARSGARAARRRSTRVRRPRDLAALPRNDLASSPLADELRALGAFRADVSGAGPAVYGLFHHRAHAEAAQRALRAPRRRPGSRRQRGTVEPC